MIIKSYKINRKIVSSILGIFIIAIFISSYGIFSYGITTFPLWDKNSNINLEDNEDYIKWVDFKVTAYALNRTAKLDIDSHNSDSDVKYNWIELLSYLAC